MKKNLVVAVAATLVLSACASHHGHMTRAMDPRNPSVFVVDGKYIVVNQEPIYIPLKDGPTTIVWQLPKDSPYSFPANGIAIADGGEEFKCNLEADKTRFACRFKNSKSGKYKYTISVTGGSEPIKPLDPVIVNG